MAPMVHGWRQLGANDTSPTTAAGAKGLKLYYLAHAVILGRAKGADKRTTNDMVERAGRIAQGELPEMWAALCAEATACPRANLA